MYLKHARRTVTGIALILALATPAAAQQPSQPLTGGDREAFLLAMGLTFMNISSSTGAGVGVNALFNTLSVTEFGRIGIVGDFGVNKFDGATATTVMAGPRLTFNTSGKVKPYGQFVLGFFNGGGDTDFGTGLGLGIDVAWRPTMNFRGEIHFGFSEPDSTRFFLGVSLPIRK